MNALYTGSLRIKKSFSILRNLTFYKWCGTKVAHCIMGKTMSPIFLRCSYQILFMLAGNDNIHESLDEFDIRPDPTTGFHGNREGYDGNRKLPFGYNEENGVSTFSRLFFILSILAGNNDMYESSDVFKFWPDWTTNCGLS